MSPAPSLLLPPTPEPETEARAVLDEFYSRPRGMRPERRVALPPRALRDSNAIALYLENISVSFDGFQALRNLTMYIDE